MTKLFLSGREDTKTQLFVSSFAKLDTGEVRRMRRDDELASIFKFDRSSGGENIILNPKSLAPVIAVHISSATKKSFGYKIVFFR